MRVMENLAVRYKMEKDNRTEEKLSGEIEQIEIEYVIQSDKKGLIARKYMHSLNSMFLKFSIRYYNSVTFIKLSINFYMSGKSFK